MRPLQPALLPMSTLSHTTLMTNRPKSSLVYTGTLSMDSARYLNNLGQLLQCFLTPRYAGGCQDTGRRRKLLHR